LSHKTHLLENGTDLWYIQEILGDSCSKTAEINTHMSAHGTFKILHRHSTYYEYFYYIDKKITFHNVAATN